MTFEPAWGQKVTLSTKHLTVTSTAIKTLFPHWLDPVTIDKAVGPNAYRLGIPGHWHMHTVFNVSALEPWHDNGTHHPTPTWIFLQGQKCKRKGATLAISYTMSQRKSITFENATATEQAQALLFQNQMEFFGPDYDSWEP